MEGQDEAGGARRARPIIAGMEVLN
jgi:hypothetical protein